jgi:ubiquinone biosynthesis protein UbiJ
MTNGLVPTRIGSRPFQLSGHTYNSFMAINPFSMIGPLALPRLALLLNHVVASEPLAMSKLAAHVGRTIDIRWTSSFVPPFAAWLAPGSTSADWAPQPVRLTVTPAGLFELETAGATPGSPASLTLTVHLTAPWTMARRALQGERPEVNIDGDAALAETASWLMKNLRWDIEDDIARWLGNTPSQALRSVGESLRQAVLRWRPQAGGRPGFREP